MMSRKRPPKPVIALVVILLAVGVGYAVWASRDNDKAVNGVSPADGTVEAEEYRVASVIAGRITSSMATEGAQVESGTVLFALDTAILDLQVTQAQAGLSAANAARQQVIDDKGTKAELAAADAKVAQAKAAVEMVLAQRGYASVTAPAAGLISSVSARVGESASPGRTLATISDLTRMYVTVYVPETEIGRVKIGDTWSVETDDGDEFTGRTTFIASESEFTPNNIQTKDQRAKLVYEVRIDIEDDSDGALKPGMPVTASFNGND